jgi:hypothetical protein
MGSPVGVVRTGPFAGWNTPYGALRRNVGSDRRLMTSTDVGLLLSAALSLTEDVADTPLYFLNTNII